MGTNLFKVYPQKLLPLVEKLLPLVAEMRAAIAEKPLEPPDLLETSSRLLREVIARHVKGFS